MGESYLERVKLLLQFATGEDMLRHAHNGSPAFTCLQEILNALISSLIFSNLFGFNATSDSPSVCWVPSRLSSLSESNSAIDWSPLRAMIRNVVRSNKTTSEAEHMRAKVERCLDRRGAFGIRV